MASDVLPAGVRIEPRQGRIVAGLTRLIAVEPGARLFLVVTTPVTGSAPLWRADLGDQVSIVAVTAQAARETAAVPAADLDDAAQVGFVGARTAKGPAYRVAVVPDGVARVRWTLGNLNGRALGHVSFPVADNAVVAPVRPAGLVLRGRWYTANGTQVHTSDRALRRAVTERDDLIKRRLLRSASQHPGHAPEALLDDFAVFSIQSRSGVRTSTGLTISHPRPSQVPLGILQIAFAPSLSRHLPGVNRSRPDLDQIRAVRGPSGSEFWVNPGSESLCVAVLDRSRLPLELNGSGAGESCTRDLRSAEMVGEGLSSGYPGNTNITYGILPTAHPSTTIRTGPRTHRTIHPPDGVYINRYVPHHQPA